MVDLKLFENEIAVLIRKIQKLGDLLKLDYINLKRKSEEISHYDNKNLQILIFSL